MAIYVSGSLAYDRIMSFPGLFEEHILPDKLHIINLSFLVDDVREHCGGTAGNISYTAALLGRYDCAALERAKLTGPLLAFWNKYLTRLAG